MPMKLSVSALAILAVLMAGVKADAQEVAATTPTPSATPTPVAGPAFSRVGRDTERHIASGEAATRAVAICSGL